MQRPLQQIIPVEANLAYWLHYVGFRVAYELRLRMRQAGVTTAEAVLLRKMHEHEQGATPSYLAHELGLSRGYIARLAVRLEAKGLIHREKSLSDRRTLVLALTDTARLLLPYLSKEADMTNARYFAEAGEPAHETVERVMKRIVFSRRFRFVPPIRCHIRKYRYLFLLQLGIDWDGGEDWGDEESS